jgi:thiosulfate/3-mercaptopyruvate sulfurtransferase
MSLHINSPLVSADWLEQHLEAPALRILDCSQVMKPRPDGSFGFVPASDEFTAAHIPGSIFVDVVGQLSDPEQALPLMMPPFEKFAASMQALGIGDGTVVVLYDRGNHAWAARVWWMLRAVGFDNAAVLDGGWLHWVARQKPVTRGSGHYPPAARFSLKPRPHLFADKARVLAAINDPDSLLLHSLPEAMFTGAVVAYARPGRISGSQNLYCELLIDPDTRCFRPPGKIRELMQTTDALQTRKVITYCGGGIAASSNALALTLLGVEDVAVYDGSLSEWTADPDLPMETG